MCKAIDENQITMTMAMTMTFPTSKLQFCQSAATRIPFLILKMISTNSLKLLLEMGEIPTQTLDSENVESGTIKVKVDVKIENKGGCDLAYLHYINRYNMEHTAASAANTIIVFLKDSPRTNKSLHQSGGWRSVPEMIDYAARGEFICGIKTRRVAKNRYSTIVSL